MESEYLYPSLKNVADLDHLADLERGAALGALVARGHLAHVVNLA